MLDISHLKIGYDTGLCPELNLSMEPSEFVAIIGTNGSGKSTLIKTLVGITKPLSGEVKINGQKVEYKKTHRLSKDVSLVLTNPIDSKSLTVKEVVSMGRYPYTNRFERLDEKNEEKIRVVMQQTSVNKLKNKPCHSISDGQMQNVMIAKALAQDTPIIFLDEPTSYLDIYHKASVLKLLKDITRTLNKMVIVSSHEIELCLQLADKILIIDPKENHFGRPKDIIDTTAFQNLIPKDIIHFSKNLMKFELK